MWLLTGRDSVYTQESLFFSKAAVVTFGGAVTVLHLSIWFALYTLFGTFHEHHLLGARLLVPDRFTLDITASPIVAGAFIAPFVFKRGMIVTLVVSAIVGMATNSVIGGNG